MNRTGVWCFALAFVFCVACGGSDTSSGDEGASADAGESVDVPVATKDLSKEEADEVANKATITGATQLEGELPVESVGAKDAVEVTTTQDEKAAYGEADTSLDYAIEAKGAGKVDGTYVKVEGSTKYWDVPVDKTATTVKQVNGVTAQSLLIRLPRVRKNARFCIRFAAHTESGVVSAHKRTCIVVPESVGDDITFVNNVCAGLTRCFQQDEPRCIAALLGKVAAVRAFQSQCGLQLRAAGTCVGALTRCSELQYLRMPPDAPADFRCSTSVGALAKCTRRADQLAF